MTDNEIRVFTLIIRTMFEVQEYYDYLANVTRTFYELLYIYFVPEGRTYYNCTS